MRHQHAEQRRRELAQIHIAIKELGMDDGTYRQLLANIQVGCSSSKDLSPAGRKKLLERLKIAGWRPKLAKKKGKITAKSPQDRKIRAIWLELAASGHVKNASEAALAAYVKRQTGIEQLQWLSTSQASQVIESLKQWVERTQEQAQ